jgi:hypothetical protein
MTVRPLQSAWRFSRNELSDKPGAVQSVSTSGTPAGQNPCTLGHQFLSVLDAAQAMQLYRLVAGLVSL